MKLKLGILMTTSPESGNTQTAVEVAKAAIAQGWQLAFFLMNDGVYNVLAHEKNPWGADFATALQAGARVTLCAANCAPRGVTRENTLPGIVLGSQYDHATMVAESDRVLVFG